MSTQTLEAPDQAPAAEAATPTKPPAPPVAVKLQSIEEFMAFLKEHGLTRRPRVALFGEERFGKPVVIRTALETALPSNAVVLHGAIGSTESTARGIAFHGLHLSTAGFAPPFRRGMNALDRMNALCARNSLILASLTPGSLVVGFTKDPKGRHATRDALAKAYLAGMRVLLVDPTGSSLEYQRDGEPEMSRQDLLASAALAYGQA